MRWLIVASMLLALSPLGCASAPVGPTAEHLTVLYFGELAGVLDQHPHPVTGTPVGGLPRLAALVGKIRKDNAAHRVPTVLLYTGGVWNDSPLARRFRGKDVVRLLRQMEVDAVAVGLDDFPGGRLEFDALAKTADLAFITANLRGKNKATPWLPLGLGKLFENGMTIGLVGASPPASPTGAAADLVVDDPLEAIPLAVARTGGPGGIDIVLSRCDLATNQKLAQQVAGLHAVIGGGAGMPLDTPWIENGVHLTGVAGRGEALGRLDFERRDGTITVLRHKTYAITPDLPEDRIMRSLVDGFLNRLNEAQ